MVTRRRLVSLVLPVSAALISFIALVHNHGIAAQSDTAQAGTYVQGIIRENSTWVSSGSPYIIDEYVQIAPSVTLTIEAGIEVKGVEINGSGGSGGIEVYGQLLVLGTNDLPVRFSSVSLSDYRDNYPGQGLIYIRNAEFSSRDSNRSFTFTIGSIGEWKIEDSAFIGTTQTRDLFGGYCRGINCQIRNSIFANMRVELDGTDTYSTAFHEGSWITSRNGLHRRNVYSNARIGFSGHFTVQNSLFQNNSELILDIRLDSPEESILQYNSLLGFAPRTLSVNLDPRPAPITNVDLANNFWGTTNSAEIETVIQDSNDSLTEYALVIYQPVLTEPHSDTPTTAPIPPALATATPTSTHTPTDGPDPAATATAHANQIATAVAATLTAVAPQPTSTGTPHPAQIYLPNIR